MIPGEYFLSDASIIINSERPTVKLTIVNTGDRPVQVGSHYHFFEVNKAMDFDREKANCTRAPAGVFDDLWGGPGRAGVRPDRGRGGR